MRPQDIPEMRAKIVAHFQTKPQPLSIYSAADQAKLNRLYPDLMQEYNDATHRRDELDQKVRDLQIGPPKLVNQWRMAELFYVAPEMAQLAGAAADAMPGFELHRDDLPADVGLLYFDNSAFSKDFDVVSTWGPAAEGLALTVYTLKFGELLYLGAMRIGYGEDLIDAEHPEMKAWALTVRCCWLLMQQRIATVTEQRPDRASGRRLQRAGKPVDAVRVITLRHPEHHGHPTSDRTYHHRWVVRGHWRKQWYPSQERNVPIWITPYVKGPDGAPLLAGEKVYAWRR
jgi:hypothetical protein